MSPAMIDVPARPAPRAQRLMEVTRRAHDGLDGRIMSADPFRDRTRYGRLLRMQYLFHRDIDALYTMTLPLPASLDLPARRRLVRICQDLHDLGQPLPEDADPSAPAGIPVDPAAAIGWLWVAEGSNLGAASLLKRAAALGLDAAFGARHLGGHPEGRGAHWKAFTGAVNALELDAADDTRLTDGACHAFAHVRRLADASLA